MVDKVGCHVYLVALLECCLGGPFLKVDIAGEVKGKRVTSGFGLQVMLGESLCVSGPFIFQISFGTIYQLA